MAFQDLIKKQINQLGKELKALMERALPLNDPDLVSLFVDDASRVLSAEIHGTLAELVQEEPEQLQKLLTGKDSEQMENLEQLADLFALLSNKGIPEAEQYRGKALAIYQHITDTTATFSFARMTKMAQLQSK